MTKAKDQRKMIWVRLNINILKVPRKCQICNLPHLTYETNHDRMSAKEKRETRMTRITQKRIKSKVDVLIRLYGVDIGVDWASGGAKIFAGKGVYISPRLPTGRMLDWLEAFQTGLDMAGRIVPSVKRLA